MGCAQSKATDDEARPQPTKRPVATADVQVTEIRKEDAIAIVSLFIRKLVPKLCWVCATLTCLLFTVVTARCPRQQATTASSSMIAVSPSSSRMPMAIQQQPARQSPPIALSAPHQSLQLLGRRLLLPLLLNQVCHRRLRSWSFGATRCICLQMNSSGTIS